MDLQTRKIQFIQEFLKFADSGIIAKFEKLLKQEKNRLIGEEIKPMTLKEYEKRIEKAFEEVKNKKVKTASNLKKEISQWK